MKTMLMYERLTPVNRDQHRALRVKASGQHLNFARETNSLLMAVTELPLAALDLPCVFVASGDQHTMVSVVGLSDKENLTSTRKAAGTRKAICRPSSAAIPSCWPSSRAATS